MFEDIETSQQTCSLPSNNISYAKIECPISSDGYPKTNLVLRTGLNLVTVYDRKTDLYL